MSSETTTTGGLAGEYPPPHHLLRDLGIWIERDAAGGRAGLTVTPQLCSGGEHAAGGVRAGVLATLVDVLGGSEATRVVAPDWIATCDLVLHLVSSVRAGSVLATPSVLRKGRSTVVIEIELAAGEDASTLVGLATLTFSVLEARGEHQRRDESAQAPRTDFARADTMLDEPLADRLGCRIVSAAEGIVELVPTPYCGNTLGAIQGGALAVLTDLAAEAAGRALGERHWVTSDLALHYLALGRQGPIRTRARILRRDEASALLRIEARDESADHRLVTAATATVEALP